MIKYFLGHSLGWILRRQKQLKLTGQQIAEEKAFKLGMQRDTGAGIAALRNAYKIYSKDAARANPSISLIKKDIDAVGQAETALGFEMVPYHLKGYEILTPAQKAIYAQFEAEFAKASRCRCTTPRSGRSNNQLQKFYRRE